MSGIIYPPPTQISQTIFNPYFTGRYIKNILIFLKEIKMMMFWKDRTTAFRQEHCLYF